MSDTYIVTIVKKTTELQTVKGAWGVVDKRPYTKEEAGNAMISNNWGEEIKEVYGYRPDREELVIAEEQMFEQEVDTLDMPVVIKAINGL